MSRGSTILDIDPHREIRAIDIEHDVHVLPEQERSVSSRGPKGESEVQFRLPSGRESRRKAERRLLGRGLNAREETAVYTM